MNKPNFHTRQSVLPAPTSFKHEINPVDKVSNEIAENRQSLMSYSILDKKEMLEVAIGVAVDKFYYKDSISAYSVFRQAMIVYISGLLKNQLRSRPLFVNVNFGQEDQIAGIAASLIVSSILTGEFNLQRDLITYGTAEIGSDLLLSKM